MDEQEYRSKLIEWDAKSLDKRVERWKRLVPATYSVELPNLIWDFLVEADDMFIRGHFIGVILLCAAILELLLADQLMQKGYTSARIRKLKFEGMTKECESISIIKTCEANEIDQIRKFRNMIIHADAGKLNEMARKRYEEWGLDLAALDAGLYLHTPWNGGIDRDAERFLSWTRDITVRLYGAS